MVRILMDSAADYPLAGQEGLECIPITVSIGGRDYADGVELTPDTFYGLLTAGEEFPKTSQPSPQAFAEIFERAKEAGEELVYVALSSALSGTYQSACIAKDMVDYQGIYLVDSLSASHGIRLLIDRAVELRGQGSSGAAIAADLMELRGRIRLCAAVETLEYLRRGGRLSKTAAAVGEIAGLKPVITVTPAGEVAVVAKCLGRLKAVIQLQKLLAQADIDTRYPLYTLYTYGQENCEFLESKLADGYTLAGRLQVGSTIGAHVGPGVFGVLYVVK